MSQYISSSSLPLLLLLLVLFCFLWWGFHKSLGWPLTCLNLILLPPPSICGDHKVYPTAGSVCVNRNKIYGWCWESLLVCLLQNLTHTVSHRAHRWFHAQETPHSTWHSSHASVCPTVATGIFTVLIACPSSRTSCFWKPSIRSVFWLTFLQQQALRGLLCLSLVHSSCLLLGGTPRTGLLLLSILSSTEGTLAVSTVYFIFKCFSRKWNMEMEMTGSCTRQPLG